MRALACVLLLLSAPVQAQRVSQPAPEDALRALEARTGTNPFDPVSMNNLASVKAARGDWQGAADLLVRAQRLAPENAVIGGNLDRLNDYLVRQQPAATDTPVAAVVIPPEPPPLWATAKSASVPRGQAKQPASRR